MDVNHSRSSRLDLLYLPWTQEDLPAARTLVLLAWNVCEC